MDQLIIDMLNALGSGPVGNFSDLMKSPGEYNSSLYSAAVALHNTAVKPITAVVLSIMIVLMLTHHSTKIQEDGQLGVRIIAATMLKAALVIIVAQQAINILAAIDSIAVDLAVGASNAGGGTAATSPNLGDQMGEEVKGAPLTDKLGMLVVLFVPFMLSKVVGVLAIVLIFVRFIQLYIMTSFASLPLSFLAHDETKGMAIGYLKRYASVALTGVVIIIALRFYQSLVADWLTTNTEGGGNMIQFVVQNFGQFFVAPLVLAFLLFGASQIANSLVGD
ncbi:type IV secretion system protein [Micrococcus luteus]|uniref:type IV secretion system protein n=1 Tax=Micrococcus luteus TaxID=1270 RepID=UPI0033B41FA3